MQKLIIALRKSSAPGLVLLTAGLAAGCGGFSGSIPISTLMFLQHRPNEAPAPVSEPATNGVLTVVWAE